MPTSGFDQNYFRFFKNALKLCWHILFDLESAQIDKYHVQYHIAFYYRLYNFRFYEFYFRFMRNMYEQMITHMFYDLDLRPDIMSKYQIEKIGQI